MSKILGKIQKQYQNCLLYNWEGISYPSEKGAWENYFFKKSNRCS